MNKVLDRITRISVRTYCMILLGIILPMFLAFGLIRQQYTNYIQEEMSQQIIGSISKSEDALYQSFRNMAGISSVIATNVPLLNGLTQQDADPFTIGRLFDQSLASISINNLYSTDDTMVTLFDRNERCYSSWDQNLHDYRFLLDAPWVRKAVEEKGFLVWELFSPAYRLGAPEGQRYISLARALLDTGNSGEIIGVLIVSLPQAGISGILKSYCYGPGDSVFMLGDSQTPILSYAPMGGITDEDLSAAFATAVQNSSGSMRMKTESGTKLVSYYTLDAPWRIGEETLRIIHFTDFQPVLQKINDLSLRLNLWTAAALLLLALITFFLVTRLVAPIKQLAHTMRHYRLGDRLDKLNMDRHDEVGDLNRSFRRLTVNLQEMFDNLNKEYRIKEQYRYESLRAQLNPHFLFNTLNTLRYMSIMQNTPSITDGIDSLASVLKYAMGRDGDLIRLADEVEHVKSYVAIQNMRFGQRIQVDDDFEPDVLSLYTLRFILQPIVENAMIHGFHDWAHMPDCCIKLYGYTEDERLHLYVEDNGSGMPPGEAELMNTDTPKQERMTGIGFHHVREMVALSFGPEYTVTLTSSPGQGTVVHFILPIIEDAKGGNAFAQDHDRR